VTQRFTQTIDLLLASLRQIERDIAVRDNRIKRLRMALEFIRSDTSEPTTDLYARSALDNDELFQ
jgi:hypothetical protein